MRLFQATYQLIRSNGGPDKPAGGFAQSLPAAAGGPHRSGVSAGGGSVRGEGTMRAKACGHMSCILHQPVPRRRRPCRIDQPEISHRKAHRTSPLVRATVRAKACRRGIRFTRRNNLNPALVGGPDSYEVIAATSRVRTGRPLPGAGFRNPPANPGSRPESSRNNSRAAHTWGCYCRCPAHTPRAPARAPAWRPHVA